MSIDIPPQAIRCTSLDEFESFLASAANRGADIAAFEVGLPKHPLLSASRHGLRGAVGANPFRRAISVEANQKEEARRIAA